jgi:hypothetical protein
MLRSSGKMSKVERAYLTPADLYAFQTRLECLLSTLELGDTSRRAGMHALILEHLAVDCLLSKRLMKQWLERGVSSECICAGSELEDRSRARQTRRRSTSTGISPKSSPHLKKGLSRELCMTTSGKIVRPGNGSTSAREDVVERLRTKGKDEGFDVPRP